MRFVLHLALCAMLLLASAAQGEQLEGDLFVRSTPFDFLASAREVSTDGRLLQAAHHLLAVGRYDDVSRDPWRLLGTRPNGWTINAWVAQGFTDNKDNPANPASGTGNLPVGYNYRSDEYQLHQAYLSVEKRADKCGGRWALGGRLDLLFGEDYLFVQATGLETDDRGRDLPGANRWNSGAGSGGLRGRARNGLAMPQAYAEVACNDVSLKIGHFYSGLIYESAMSPQNAFYSHSYNFLYAMPITLTGALGEWRWNDSLSLVGGLHNGRDVFDGPSGQVGFLGGARWHSCDERTSLQVLAITGEEPLALTGVPPMPAGRDTQNAVSLIFSWRLNCRWQFAFEQVSGWHDRGSFEAAGIGTADAEWYSFNQYLFYSINDYWQVGARYEWFNADDGAPVANFGGQYQAATLGLNYAPTENVTIRPEVRWDRFDPHDPTAPAGPFVDSTRRSQFLAGLDVVVVF